LAGSSGRVRDEPRPHDRGARTFDLAAAGDSATNGFPARHGYRPDHDKVITVRLLAIGLVLIALFGAAPAVMQFEFAKRLAASNGGSTPIVKAAETDWSLSQLPRWARCALVLAAMQLFYVAWMVTLPDWSTVWVVSWVFASMAAAYAAALAVLWFTPRPDLLILDLAGVEQQARRWCIAVTLLLCLASYLAGRTSFRWHRAFRIAAGQAV
jgi:hypothetical protein